MMEVIGRIKAIKMLAIVVTLEVDNSHTLNNGLRHFVIIIASQSGF